ncbi:MAG: peptide MFS transporter [Candidatus Melainabacteria bacterium]|nr:peptide MFS transporter [Candidatus Melainabacteria bacterium]
MSTTLADETTPSGDSHSLMDNTGLWGHPSGLTTLFFTELWERFSYYGMRAILMLYMVAALSDGGMGLDTRTAATIYGVYTSSVYVTSIPGGLIADKLLGAKMSILIGGSIIALGHFTLAIHSHIAFYGGLILIILGTGLLKPNISTLLGSLYSADDDRRDGGFSIFYMGINIGAALSPLVCGYLAQSEQFKTFIAGYGFKPSDSWHFGFAAAGVGMVIGLAHFLFQYKRLGSKGSRPIGAKAALAVDRAGGAENVAEEKLPLTKQEWSRLGAIAILFCFAAFFWAVYEQDGSSLNLFADRLTDCSFFGWKFPSSWFQTLPAVYCIILAPTFSILWTKLGRRQPSSPAKFAIGLALLGAGISIMVPASLLAAQGKVGPYWLVFSYLLQVLGEMCLSPVGLSTVTKLAPARFASSTMGMWMLATACGNFLAGYLAGFFNENSTTTLITMFGFMGGFLFLAAAILWALTPLVRKLMSGIR